MVPYSSVHVRLCEGDVVAAHGITECCVRAALQCVTDPELFIPTHLEPWAARGFPESLCANPEPTGSEERLLVIEDLDEALSKQNYVNIGLYCTVDTVQKWNYLLDSHFVDVNLLIYKERT